MFTKATSMMIFLTTSTTMMICSMNMNMMVELKLTSSLSSYLSMSMSMDSNSMMFLFMVSLVTSSVLSFSTMYMESYNKKKFFFIMMIFFSSMVMLTCSESMMTTVTGWDGLGISSIALIMMYQNFNTMSNSLLTMFFNRIGDFLLFLSLMFLINEMEEKFNDSHLGSSNLPLSMLLMATALSKSAQIPLSAWLPAAMSAPTPISAMVHSSTLVTAGIYLTLKMSETMNKVMDSLSLISASTLMLASLSANTEKDLKKIIAFSTMSQISMIMMMNSLLMKTISMVHMINHAMFKTLLFMSAGKMFMEKWSMQDSRMIKSSKMNKMCKSAITVSIVSMTGIPFSCSFFSKDKFMEQISWENKMNMFMIIMMISSMATMMYCKKILKSLNSETLNNMTMKKMSTPMFFIMGTISYSSGSLNSWIMETYQKPIISKEELKMLNSMIMVFIFVELNINNKNLNKLSNNMLFLKWLTSNLMLMFNKKTKINEAMDFVYSNKTLWVMENKTKIKELNILIPIFIMTTSLMFLLL